jgi:hypothetical protein
MAKRQARVDLVMAGDGQTDLGIVSAHAGGGFALGHRIGKRLTQKGGRFGVEKFKPGYSRCGIRKGGGLGGGGGQKNIVVHHGRPINLIGHVRACKPLKQVKF